MKNDVLLSLYTSGKVCAWLIILVVNGFTRFSIWLGLLLMAAISRISPAFRRLGENCSASIFPLKRHLQFWALPHPSVSLHQQTLACLSRKQNLPLFFSYFRFSPIFNRVVKGEKEISSWGPGRIRLTWNRAKVERGVGDGSYLLWLRECEDVELEDEDKRQNLNRPAG